MAKYLIEKTFGLFNLKPLYDFLSHRKDGKYMIEVVLMRPKRSLDQNGWLFGCIYPMLLDALIDAGYEFVSVEQVHEFFKMLFTSEKIVNKHTGEIITIPQSTAYMDTLTFATYCEKLREYALEYLNVPIPDPDPNWRNN